MQQKPSVLVPLLEGRGAGATGRAQGHVWVGGAGKDEQEPRANTDQLSELNRRWTTDGGGGGGGDFRYKPGERRRPSSASSTRDVRGVWLRLCFWVKWRLVLVLENWSNNNAARRFVFRIHRDAEEPSGSVYKQSRCLCLLARGAVAVPRCLERSLGHPCALRGLRSSAARGCGLPPDHGAWSPAEITRAAAAPGRSCEAVIFTHRRSFRDFEHPRPRRAKCTTKNTLTRFYTERETRLRETQRGGLNGEGRGAFVDEKFQTWLLAARRLVYNRGAATGSPAKKKFTPRPPAAPAPPPAPQPCGATSPPGFNLGGNFASAHRRIIAPKLLR